MKDQFLFLLRLLFICLYTLVRSFLDVPYFSVLVFILCMFEIALFIVKKIVNFDITYKVELRYTIAVISISIIATIGLEFFV